MFALVHSVRSKTCIVESLYFASRVSNQAGITMADNIFDIESKTAFTDIVNRSELVIVDFHAHWCGPCRTLGPILEEAVKKRHGRVVLAKVDVDENDELAREYNVVSIPKILLMLGGKIIESFEGCKRLDEVDAIINKAIGE